MGLRAGRGSVHAWVVTATQQVAPVPEEQANR